MNADAGPPAEFAGGPVPVPPDGVLDLHGFRPQDVADVVTEYLADCHARGVREIRIIHGKGIGELRRTVRTFSNGIRWSRPSLMPHRTTAATARRLSAAAPGAIEQRRVRL